MRRWIMVGAVLLTGQMAMAAPAWYEVTFTGVDVWTYSADNLAQSRTDQDAPRRHRDWTQSNPVRSTTYGVDNQGSAAVDFNTWVAGSGFAFDSLNLWGAGGAAATAWGEKYVSVGTTEPEPGESSWSVLQAPPGWTNGIVEGGDPWSADATHAFPVWRSGTGATLGLSNMSDPSFVFKFRVLISNPESAFETDGKLRVFFGGYSDDLQGKGPGNYEVSGIMRLDATAVPLPTAAWSGVALLAGMGLLRRARRA